jgi:hypothetical protein
MPNEAEVTSSNLIPPSCTDMSGKIKNKKENNLQLVYTYKTFKVKT